MHSPKLRGVLLDIEGTTSSIQFVYEVMFPFARRELARYLAEQWGADELQAACEQIAKDAGYACFKTWCETTRAASDETARQLVREEALRLMDADMKTIGLKALQGLIWRSGFETGEMKAHVFDDVPPALERWKQNNVDVRIYSSGSIAAQKLFFRHTIAGDLLPLVKGHYDTTTGPKQQADSYQRIAADFGLPARDVLFISDVSAELDAARSAGTQTALCRRPGNADVAADHGHPEITTFLAARCV